MGWGATAQNRPCGISSGCTCVSQTIPRPSRLLLLLWNLRAFEGLEEGTSSHTSNPPHRPSLAQPPLSASPPDPRPLSKSPHPRATPCSPPTGKPSREAPGPRAGDCGRPRRPAQPRPLSAPARRPGGRGRVGAARPGTFRSLAAGLALPAPQLLPGRPPASDAAEQSRTRSAAKRGRRSAADWAGRAPPALLTLHARPAPPCGRVRRCASGERGRRRRRPSARTVACGLRLD